MRWFLPVPAMPVRQRFLAFLCGFISLLTVTVTTSTAGLAQCGPGAILCETFGTGPRGELAAGLTNFSYRAKACPDDGEYTLMDTVPATCHGQAWHRVPEDHTPNDQRGNMFVVNASYQPSEFYSQTVKGLCPGITYELSLWALNLNLIGTCDNTSLRNPIIAMRIEHPDGTLIREVVQPAIERSATPTWVQLSMQFSIPTASNDIVVKFINNGLGGCGNDLVIDDIGFRPVHPNLSIQFVNSAATEITVCADSRLTLTVGAAAGYPNPVYLWQQSTDNINWTPIANAGQARYTLARTRPGRTYYRLRNTQPINEAAVGRAQCSAESNTLIVNGRPDAPFSLGEDLVLCDGTSRVLTVPAALPTGTSYVWSNQSQDRQLTVTMAGDYWLETNLDGCTFRDTVSVNTRNCRLNDVYVPTAFSPNGDSVNDRFDVLHAASFTTYSLRVYDRWGNLIFASEQADTGWDGSFRQQPCPEGVYAWTVSYSLPDEHNELHRFTRSGRVTLVR